MIPEEEPSEKMFKEPTKEEIQMQLDKIPELEKKLDRIENELNQFKRSNKSQHKKIWLKLEEGDNDV